MKKRNSTFPKDTATVPRLLAIVIVLGLLLTLPFEQALAKGRPWVIEVHIGNEDHMVQEDGELEIKFTLFDEEGENVGYEYITIKIEGGWDKSDIIRNKIANEINTKEKGPLSALICEESNQLTVCVDNDFNGTNYVTINSILWRSSDPDLYLKTWDP
jgi:uncharacterized protein YrzB (UPF0473 family)